MVYSAAIHFSLSLEMNVYNIYLYRKNFFGFKMHNVFFLLCSPHVVVVRLRYICLIELFVDTQCGISCGWYDDGGGTPISISNQESWVTMLPALCVCSAMHGHLIYFTQSSSSSSFARHLFLFFSLQFTPVTLLNHLNGVCAHTIQYHFDSVLIACCFLIN